jgi:LL-diaminopimelate aminotransferase
MITPANRIAQSKRYVFDELAQMKKADRRDPSAFFDLSIGNPDSRPDPEILEMLGAQLRSEKFQNHRYSPFDGALEFRKAVSEWYGKRFGVTGIDPDGQVLPLIGSKEGIAHLLLAYVDPGDTVVIATPCYPAYLSAARVVEANVVELPLRAENGFLPDYSEISADVWDRAKFLFFNYPNNPTGAVAEMDTFEQALALARKHDFIAVSDLAYTELALEPGCPTPSIMQLDNAADHALEFHSFSKSYSMAGWRLGWVVGNREVLGNLVKVKASVDFSVFLAIQRTGAEILLAERDFAEPLRRAYRRRRDLLVDGFAELGWTLARPRAAMYIWDRVPARYGDKDFEFVKDFFDATGVIVSPGSAFGAHCQGFMRISMVIDEAAIARMFEAVRKSGFRFA